jgi:C4-type Zn-finger protein
MEKKFDENFEDEVEASEVENFVPYQNPTANADEALRLIEGCPICGCKLHFTNFTDFARMVSHEVVRCDDCGYRAKKDMMQLQ